VRTFKNVLCACHNEIRNNEGLEPIEAFDERSKVLFCKLYEEKENPQWRGGGAFVREEKLGKEIKAKKLNRASAGWLTYNRLFAFRGSLLCHKRTMMVVTPPANSPCLD